jgi:DNA-binding NarL/FixJ family response regulator
LTHIQPARATGKNQPGEQLPSRRSEGQRPEEHACSSALTQHERAVLGLICIGRSNKLIARELDIEASTVKLHVKNIMRKLDVTNRTQLCALMHGVEPHTISSLKRFSESEKLSQRTASFANS